MELLTIELEAQIPQLYTTEKTPLEEKVIVAKFFTPDSNWSWYVTEGQRMQNHEFLFFGIVDGFEREWGYFSLSEILNLRGPMGLPVERDLQFKPSKVKDIFRKD